MTDKSTSVLAPEAAVPALKIIGEVKALNIQSEYDVVVLKIAFPINAAETERLISTWRSATRLVNPVVCLIEGVDVDVVRPPTGV